jgi:hypothetical protein
MPFRQILEPFLVIKIRDITGLVWGGIMAGALRKSIGLKRATKAKLDRNRAPGQCYDGFVCQLVDLWEKTNERRISLLKAGPAGGNQGA